MVFSGPITLRLGDMTRKKQKLLRGPRVLTEATGEVGIDVPHGLAGPRRDPRSLNIFLTVV